MATIKRVNFERSGLGKGIKTAALVLVLTAGALMADHVFFVAPSARTVVAPVTAKADVPATDAVGGFALPENLRRPTAADAADTGPTF